MPLSAGTKLGPYEILARIGAGGMGEVYRAHDPRMGRNVAIKISAERFSDRFSREVHAVAALNHPNICHLYDVGPDYLVMELVEGPTLAERIRQGAVPLHEALGIAKQIAEGLEAAHEKGVVHRDLKPGNIKLRPDGTAKVLDFGLAKMTDTTASGERTEDSPTLTVDAATRVGVILGTAAYMPPEQARGKPVDKRADIWAFGVVLYEMLTGERLFEGETVSDTLIEVATKEPNWKRVPQQVQRLLRLCLEKDPKDRLRDIGDAWAILQDDQLARAAPPPSAGRRWRWPSIAAMLAMLAATATFLWVRASSQPPLPLIRFQVAPPRDTFLRGVPQISPDGQTLAFVAAAQEKPAMIYVRPLSETASRVLPGTEGTVYCFWSPDGRSLGFTTESKELKRIELADGLSRTLTTIGAATNSGTWGRQGDILIFGGLSHPVVERMAASGGPLTPVTQLNDKAREKSHVSPLFLPDGKHFLFYVLANDATHDSVEYATLGSFVRKQVLEGASAAMYARDSGGRTYLLYERGVTLMAQSFDESAGAVTGEAVAIADNVGTVSNNGWRLQSSASLTGTLAYFVGPATSVKQLTWFDRQGKALEPVGEPGRYGDLVISPDGTRVAVELTQGADARSQDIWVLELDRGISTPLTSNQTVNRLPVWSPDGRRIVFSSERNGHMDLFVKAADGTGSEELLLHSDQDKFASDFSWSRDGRYLIYTSVDPQTKQDLWILPMAGDRTPFVFLRTPFNEMEANFSPDGHWISYSSDESGRYELYVRLFTPPGAAPSSAGNSSEGKWRISKDGGLGAYWRQDGKGLSFVGPHQSGQGQFQVMSVDLSVSPAFHAGVPHELFRFPVGSPQTSTSDLKKFLIAVPPPANDAPQSITVVLNWVSALKR